MKLSSEYSRYMRSFTGSLACMRLSVCNSSGHHIAQGVEIGVAQYRCIMHALFRLPVCADNLHLFRQIVEQLLTDANVVAQRCTRRLGIQGTAIDEIRSIEPAPAQAPKVTRSRASVRVCA